MNGRLKTVGIVVACLACCLPLILAVAGATTGAAGAFGYWLGRNEALIVAAFGLTYLIILANRHTRARSVSRDRLPTPKRKEPVIDVDQSL